MTRKPHVLQSMGLQSQTWLSTEQQSHKKVHGRGGMDIPSPTCLQPSAPGPHPDPVTHGATSWACSACRHSCPWDRLDCQKRVLETKLLLLGKTSKSKGMTGIPFCLHDIFILSGESLDTTDSCWCSGRRPEAHSASKWQVLPLAPPPSRMLVATWSLAWLCSLHVHSPAARPVLCLTFTPHSTQATSRRRKVIHGGRWRNRQLWVAGTWKPSSLQNILSHWL